MKTLTKIGLSIIWIFIFSQLISAYPSSSQAKKDVENLLKSKNIKYTNLKMTDQWYNDWSEEKYKTLGYPNDEAYTWVYVTYPKSPEGGVMIQKFRLIYSRAVKSSADKWSFKDLYPYDTELTGVPMPSKEELLKIAIEALKTEPRFWFDPMYEKIKRIHEIKVHEPLEYKRNAIDHMKFNVYIKYDVANINQLITSEKIIYLDAEKKDNKWAALSTTAGSNFKTLKTISLTAPQIESMKNLKVHGFDAIYGSKTDDTPKPFPPQSEILASIRAAVMENESKFTKIIGVEPALVLDVYEGLIIEERLMKMNTAKWESDGTFTFQMNIRYMYWDKKSTPNPMQYYLTKVYMFNMKDSGSGKYIVNKVANIGEPQIGSKSKAKESYKTYHDKFTAPGK